MNNLVSKRTLSAEDKKVLGRSYRKNMLMFILKIDMFLIPFIIGCILLFKYTYPNKIYTIIIPAIIAIPVLIYFLYNSVGITINRWKLLMILWGKSNVYEIEGKLVKDKRYYKISHKKVIFFNKKELKSLKENDYIKAEIAGESEPYFILKILSINK